MWSCDSREPQYFRGGRFISCTGANVHYRSQRMSSRRAARPVTACKAILQIRFVMCTNRHLPALLGAKRSCVENVDATVRRDEQTRGALPRSVRSPHSCTAGCRHAPGLPEKAFTIGWLLSSPDQVLCALSKSRGKDRLISRKKAACVAGLRRPEGCGNI
jgi:hypothetical protein